MFTFDGNEVNFQFEDNKNYMFFGAPDFRIVIHTSGPVSASYITEIGISLGTHQFLASSDDLGPMFYFDGQPVSDQIETSMGVIEFFIPESLRLRGALSQLARFLVIGVRIPHKWEIVAGIHPGKGVFFNIEVNQPAHELGFGLLLAAASQHNGLRDDFLSQFETTSLFE